MCFDGGIGKSGWGKLMPVFGSESEILKNCYDGSQQVVNGGPEWSCDSKCVTMDDFVDEVF